MDLICTILFLISGHEYCAAKKIPYPTQYVYARKLRRKSKRTKAQKYTFILVNETKNTVCYL